MPDVSSSPHLNQLRGAFAARLEPQGKQLVLHAFEIAHYNALAARQDATSPQSHTSRHRARRGAGDGVVTR